MVKKVGEAGGDIAYYSTEGKDDPNAGPKIASAVTDIVIDAPQIIVTVAGGANLAKGALGKTPAAVPKPAPPKPTPKPIPKPTPKPAPPPVKPPAAPKPAPKAPAKAPAKPATPAATPKGKKWQVGDPHDAPTQKGTPPSWRTVRERYWKNRAASAPKGEFSEANLKRMQKGKPPIDPDSGLPMELEHIEPQRSGSPTMHRDLLEVTPLEHSFFDRFRKFTDPAGNRFRTNRWTDPRP
jgi:outer membrane biosynthesis protein TonB